MTASNALPIGTRLGDYTIESVLGSGGFGITYGAFDARLETPVALKEYFPASLAFRSDGSTVSSRADAAVGGYDWGMDKFLQEATALAVLQHTNIVGVRRLFKSNNTAYMALDFIDGPSLKDWVRSLNRPPTQAELDQLLIPLLSALEMIHHKGLLHRDIAPKNVMIAPPLTPILIDFGAARQLVAEHSHTFAALLTPGYAPFEQYGAHTKSQGPWTDIYALAASVYELIAGKLPPEAPDRAVQDKYIPAAQLGADRYRPEFLAAVDWGLRPLPPDRPQSVEAWRMAFAGGSQTRRNSDTTIITPKTSRSRWWGSRTAGRR